MKDTKNANEYLIERLKEYVENVAGFKLCTPKDFDNLTQNIFKETGSLLSSTTLKRLWGYLQEKKEQTPRLSTLDILSKFIGYVNYATFCKYQQMHGECESDFINNNCIQAKSLLKGDKIRLLWQPDRCVTIQYIGLCMFKVIESRNSKLSLNDVFICERIIDGESLLLSNLIHNGSDPVNYICGKKNGVKFQLLEK
ncbi:MAG: hypothetical protein J6V23_08135 [Bacteroidaceae bacterium]|nr:hypothetical protein [Bacteroidaceae bacterium]